MLTGGAGIRAPAPSGGGASFSGLGSTCKKRFRLQPMIMLSFLCGRIYNLYMVLSAYSMENDPGKAVFLRRARLFNTIPGGGGYNRYRRAVLAGLKKGLSVDAVECVEGH